MVQRAPVEAALRVAPTSPQVLSRAAEAELAEGRPDQAGGLAGLALQSAPFDVRALRVLGLTLEATDPERADQILTLAGNWSLRDDPVHAWLTQQRLRRGDYASAFGHADLLARRREDLRPQLFDLFTTSAAEDPRSRPALADRLAQRPNWRGAYLRHLRAAGTRGVEVQAALATGMAGNEGELTGLELGAIYVQWLQEGRVDGVVALRARLEPGAVPIQDGGFESAEAVPPFGWSLSSRPGLFTMTSERDDGRGHALFVESDGYRGGIGASQHLTLRPGRWKLTLDTRIEEGRSDPRLAWQVVCVGSGQSLGRWRPSHVAPGWNTAGFDFSVPPVGCTVQRLELQSLGGDRRTMVFAWFDDVQIKAYR